MLIIVIEGKRRHYTVIRIKYQMVGFLQLFFYWKKLSVFKHLSGTFIIYTKLLITWGKNSVVSRKDYFYKILSWNKNSADSALMKG